MTESPDRLNDIFRVVEISGKRILRTAI